MISDFKWNVRAQDPFNDRVSDKRLYGSILFWKTNRFDYSKPNRFGKAKHHIVKYKIYM